MSFLRSKRTQKWKQSLSQYIYIYYTYYIWAWLPLNFKSSNRTLFCLSDEMPQSHKAEYKLQLPSNSTFFKWNNTSQSNISKQIPGHLQIYLPRLCLFSSGFFLIIKPQPAATRHRTPTPQVFATKKLGTPNLAWDAASSLLLRSIFTKNHATSIFRQTTWWVKMLVQRQGTQAVHVLLPVWSNVSGLGIQENSLM